MWEIKIVGGEGLRGNMTEAWLVGSVSILYLNLGYNYMDIVLIIAYDKSSQDLVA